MTITRRDAIIRLATLMGSSVLGPRLLAVSFPVKPSDPQQSFSAAEIALLDEIGETIIPATDVPGAKATQIGAFIAMMVNDCYEPRDQATFKKGLRQVDEMFRSRHGGSFAIGSAANRTTLLNELDREQKAYTKKDDPDQPPHYFRMMKELTILGYFSSEIGCTQALRYMESPGGYNGSAPYKKGEHAYFS